ncbi:hypothetical protein AVEN_185021-1 [Araneus ventricosus]|uniref:Partial AB-hydrolase lipase domain-containing protein n=1 Tax=Araneus ventricosus TaxID=182803 RepID=A0A4Y2BQX2_ARAVE|nr:hypothetical protein AVEN_185021-1 [Araneus ventricosus]
MSVEASFRKLLKLLLPSGMVLASEPQGSNSTKNPPCMWAWLLLNLTPWVRRSLGGYQLRSRPWHLTAAQNYEGCPKRAVVMFQHGMLI